MNLKATRISELISQLRAIETAHGDLPVGGDTATGVSLTVCDAEGCEASATGRPPQDVFVEAR